MYLSVVIPTAVLFALAAVARLLGRSWLAPGSFFTLFWGVLVGLSYIVPEYPIWEGTLWWIVATCVTFYIGSLICADSERRLRHLSARVPRVIAGPPVFVHLPAVLGTCFVAGLIYTVAAVAGVFSIAFGERPPLAYQALLSFHFAGPLLGGMALGAKTLRGWWRSVALLPLIPPAVLAVMFAGRMAFVTPCVYALAGYVSLRVLTERKPVATFMARRVLAALGIAVGFVVIALILDVFRGSGGTHLAPSERIAAYPNAFEVHAVAQRWRRLRPAVFGQVYSFSNYFVHAWHVPPSPSLGSIIFAAPLDLLGFGGERYPFENFEVEPGVDSNTYTMLRPPIDDFGLLGSLVWWLLLGFAQGWAYRRVRSGNVPSCVLLSWFYVDVAVIGGYFFRYNAILLGNLMTFLYLWYSSAHATQSPLSRFIARKNVLSSKPGHLAWRSPLYPSGSTTTAYHEGHGP